MDGDGCIGILVTHGDGRVECLEPDCIDDDAVRHDWRLLCTELTEPGDACTDPVPDRQWQAA